MMHPVPCIDVLNQYWCLQSGDTVWPHNMSWYAKHLVTCHRLRKSTKRKRMHPYHSNYIPSTILRIWFKHTTFVISPVALQHDYLISEWWLTRTMNYRNPRCGACPLHPLNIQSTVEGWKIRVGSFGCCYIEGGAPSIALYCPRVSIIFIQSEYKLFKSRKARYTYSDFRYGRAPWAVSTTSVQNFWNIVERNHEFQCRCVPVSSDHPCSISAI